jgi:ABC-2 type transport system permease protein
MNLANTFPMLLRREAWEHRSLWIAPLVWVGVIVLLSTVGTFQMTRDNDIAEFASATSVEEIQGMSEAKREHIREALSLEKDRGQTVYAFSYLAIGALISGFMCIVVFFYLIDCLFSERRDRSILFWKSLPVSDTQVVLSKFVMAMVVVPIGVLVLSAATQLLLLGIWNLRFGDSLIGALTPDWDILSWFRAQALEAGILLGGLMWYAPIAAYFLLLSVWVKRLAFLWAVIPLVAAPLLEFLFLRTSYIGEFLGDRFGGFVAKMNLDSHTIQASRGDHDMPRVQDLYDAFELSGVFTSLETWMGMAAAAVLLFAAIRIRRYRDES